MPKYGCSALTIFILLASTMMYAQTRTSVQSGDWTTASTWDCACVPGTTEDAVIDAGHTVTLTAATTINNFTINDGGVFDYNGFVLTANGTVTPFISDQSGAFGTATTWLNGTAPGITDKAIIITGHTVTSSDNQCADLYVNTGSVLSTGNNKTIIVTSSITIDGTVKLNSTNPELILSTGPVTVAGTGTIDATATARPGMTVNATTTVASGTDLNIINGVEIAAGITLTLNGTITVDGNVTGLSAASQVTTGTDGSLVVNGTLLTTGLLDASGSGSTIEYNNSGAQTIKAATGSYHHLTISGAGTKTFPASAMDLNGDLTVSSGTLDINSQNITIGGDWNNSGTISNLATVTFDGSADQGLSSNATNFINVTVNKGGGNLTLNEDVTVTGTLTMTTGDIDTDTYSLTLGSGAEGTFSYTAGRIIGTFGQYIASTTTTAFNYPIGTSTNNRTVAITFDMTGGGRSAGVVYAAFVATDPGASGFPVTDDVTLYNAFNEGYWDFTVNGFSKGNSNSFDLSLTGDGFSSFTIGANTRLLQRDDAGTAWAADGTHISVSTNTITRNNITTFVSQFCFADDTNCTGPADPTISGSSDVCASAMNEVYSVTLTSGNDYNFTVVGGTIDEAGGGTTTGFVTDQNSITVDWSSTGQVGSVSIVERNTCTSSNSVTLDVNINSIAPASISGSDYVAENSLNKVYSVIADANTSYNWTVVGGTIDGQTNPTGDVADLNSITVDWGSYGTGSVSVTATKTTPSCSASTATQLSVSKYIVVDSNSGDAACNGDWDDDDCWATSVQPLTAESASILSGNTISLKFAEFIDNLTVSGTLDLAGNTLTISGDLEIPAGGSIIATGGGTIVMSSSSSSPLATIDGTGTISGGNITISNASKKVASTAVLTIPGNVTINSGLTLSNEGILTLSGVVTGADGTSILKNAANAQLTFSSATAPMATGILNASATGNTVTYANATGVTIKAPATSYYNLEVSTGTQSLGATTDVNGEFTLTSGTFAMGANNMTVAGDLTYTAGTLTTTGTITLDGTANQIVSGTWSIPNLTINNTLNDADAVTTSSAITVSTLLTLTDGILGTGGNVLTVSNTATGAISGGSTTSFINGILARQTNTTSIYDFPVGAGTTFKRAGVTPTAAGGSTFQVEGYAGGFNTSTINTATLNNVSNIDYWDIQRTAGTDGAQIRLYWNTQAASQITSATELLVGHFTLGQWESIGNGANSGDVDPGYVESASAVATFSPFSFASNSSSLNPLPVELVSFEGKSNEREEVVLTWITASELNNDIFIIERSQDNETYYPIGSVAGQGTVNQFSKYGFVDVQPFFGISYYRLIQKDYDGTATIYGPILVDNNNFSEGLRVSLYPNPTEASDVHLGIVSGDENSPIRITMHDLMGQLVYEEQISPVLGSSHHQLTIDQNLRAGIYLIHTRQGNYKQTQRLIIR